MSTDDSAYKTLARVSIILELTVRLSKILTKINARALNQPVLFL